MPPKAHKPTHAHMTPLAPPPMRSGVITFHDRQRQRLGNLAREAALHARDGQELRTIEKVCDAADTGHIELEDARKTLAALRADQRGLADAA